MRTEIIDMLLDVLLTPRAVHSTSDRRYVKEIDRLVVTELQSMKETTESVL